MVKIYRSATDHSMSMETKPNQLLNQVLEIVNVAALPPTMKYEKITESLF